ncbi:hypothetical protein [Nonomuraea sediminis]|uniref:hypothetical protein n=1 Tax=Nonomuraea sediminis TaxID=2835864 RepID=UPI001BDC7579|nr:hypothetical protein [Nonomuraea sediminis]
MNHAICLGGPCHGVMTDIDQDIGTLAVPVPRTSPDEVAVYRITGERVRYSDQPEPFVVLHWAGCSCEA